MIRSLLLSILLIVSLFHVKAEENNFGKPSFFIRTSAFMENGFIPNKYTCDGINVSPDLFWGDFPPETKSFVIIMEDPDAPTGVFTHWIVYDIPYTVTALNENLPKTPIVNGYIKQGINDFGRIGYFGPCPPRGMPHRYFIRIYALDIPVLGLPPGAVKQDVMYKMEGHILAQTHIVGLYGR